MQVKVNKGRLYSPNHLPTAYNSIPAVEIEDIDEIKLGSNTRSHFWRGPWKGELVPYRTIFGGTVIL